MIFMRRVKLFFDVMRRRCRKVYMPSNDNACFSVKRKKYFSRRRKTLCHVLRYPENFMEWMPFERGNLKNASCTKMIRRGGVKACRCLRLFCTGRSMAGRTFRPECGRLVKDVGDKKRGLALPAWGAADVRHPTEPEVEHAGRKPSGMPGCSCRHRSGAESGGLSLLCTEALHEADELTGENDGEQRVSYAF